jgi:acyl-CoA reductase-like NAD-dependent aldehyde dehydrogenase
MPWNFPVALPLRAMVPGLLAGNGIVFKPSEHTARLGAFLGALCAEHLPTDLVQVVQGGAAQGAAVAASDVNRVFFTGSVATGKKVHRLAAEHFKPTSLELGGKDAAVVLPDADPSRAAAGLVWAAFGFAGQNCAAIERAYIHSSIFDEVRAQVIERARALRPMLDVGPLVTPEQLETVKRHVADATEKGATIEVGGAADGPGWYHQPTVLTNVHDDMLLMREESFGPLLPLQPYDDLDTVVEAVNNTDYGLTTSIWSRDIQAAEAMAGRFDCGVVTVNNPAFTGALPSASWGGTKQTGHGVTNSRFALYEMVRPRTVVVDTTSGDKEMWWYPYNDALVSAVRGLTELTRPGGAKLQGIRGALTGLLNRWKAEP